MSEDVGVVAAGVFEGVGKDGKAVEGTLFVDGLSEFRDGAIVPGQPMFPLLHPTAFASLR